MQLTLKSKVKKNSRLITKKIGQETIILDPTAGEIRKLNETASIIWQMIKRKPAVEEITNKISQEFNVSSPKARKDVLDFLEKYLKENLIKIIK